MRRIALAATTIAGVLALSSTSFAASATVAIDTFRFALAGAAA